MSTALEPRHVHPLKWHHALDVARETCARLFADGCSPSDVVRAFGLEASGPSDWALAVNVVAEALYAGPVRLQQVA